MAESKLNIQCFVVNMIEENCYILWDDSKEAVIVDCGAFYEEEKEQIRSFITEKGLTVRHLLNTHGHFDHVFGNAFISETYGINPQLSWDETDTYLVAAEQMRQFIHRDIPLTLPPIGRSLMDGDEIVFGNHTLRVISTPGHTPGGICFYCQQEGVLLSGDSLFLRCIGRCDLPGGNEQLLVESLRSKVLTLPEEVRVLPGHGPETTIANEKKNNIYLI